MVRKLIAIQLRSALLSSFGNQRRKKSRGTGMIVLFAFLLVYLAGVFGFLFYQMFSSLTMLCSMGLTWAYFAYACLMSFALCFIGSIFLTQSQLYRARDNELLLSLPIKPSNILMSRMVILLLFNYLYAWVVWIPAGLAFTAIGSLNVLYFVLLAFTMPLLPMTFSCLFGWFLAIALSRVRRKSLYSTIGYLIFFGVYYYLYSQASRILQQIIANPTGLSRFLGTLLPFQVMGQAMADGNAVSILYAVFWGLAPFIVACVILSATFIRTATHQRGARKIKYEKKALKVSTVQSALVKREFTRVFTSSVYLINALFGILILLVAAVLIIIYRDKIPQFLPMFTQLGLPIPLVLTAVLCLTAGMNIVTAPSVSMEGKWLWIIRSVPVSTWQILMAKLQAHLILCLPITVLTGCIFGFVLDLGWADLLATVLCAAITVIFSGILGLVLNLRFPVLDWVNETYAVKNSASTSFAVLGMMALVVAPFGLYLLFLGDVLKPIAFEIIYFTLFTIVSFAFLHLLRSWGVKKFNSL